MPITVPTNAADATDSVKPGTASVTLTAIPVPAAGQRLLICLAWQGSVAAQAASLSEVTTSNYDIVECVDHQASGKSGVAAYLCSLKPGKTVPASNVFSFAVSTGTITSMGVTNLIIAAGGHDVEIAVVNYDSASATSSAPTMTSGSAATGDLVIAILGLSGPTGDAFTQDTDTTNGSWVTIAVSGTTGGSATTNETLRGAYKIVTGAGTQTYNPAPGTARNLSGAIFGIKGATVVSSSDTGSGADATGALVARVSSAEATSPAAGNVSGFGISASDVAGNIDVWTTPSNVLASDNAVASVSGSVSGLSDILNTVFSAASLGVPAGATFVGVEFTVEVDATSNAGANTVQAKIGAHTGTSFPLTFAPASVGNTVVGSPTSLMGLSTADWAAFLAGTNNLEFMLAFGSDNGVSGYSISIDSITAKIYYTAPVSNAAEGASVNTGPGNTQKSDSDSNGTTTEGSSLVAVLPSSDVNGTTTETSTPQALVSGSDVNGSVTETERIALLSSDTNGATTEGSTPKALVSSADANGSTNETSSPTAAVSSSDVNGTTTETPSLTASVPSSDSGAGSDAGSLVAKVSGSDSGSSTEGQSVVYILSSSDSNLSVVEGSTVLALLSSSDQSASTVELASLVAKVAGSDSGTSTETQTLGAGNFLVFSSDTNGPTTETESVHQFKTGSDSGVSTETQIVRANVGSSDTGSGIDTGIISKVLIVYSDFGSATETTSLVAAISSSDSGSSEEGQSISIGRLLVRIPAGAIEGETTGGIAVGSTGEALSTGRSTTIRPGDTARATTGRIA